MAKKTQSATGQQVRAEQPDQAEQKLSAGQQGGERHARAEPSGHEWTFVRPSEDSFFSQRCQALGRTA